ncbi:MAG: phytanoyl-CoA dioxygenase family protein [Crocinitomicaceae bacterium]|nr:phytanoyl-CoA dioxygenase family protein [Crocinitomicaceae bacterium]
MAITVKRNYLNWKPVKHVVFKDDELAEQIHSTGFSTFEGLSAEQLSQLNDLFDAEHSFDVKEGGMFYSMYSRDKEYRKRVHETIAKILQPTLERQFKDYKNVVNAFVVKLPGEKSEFYVHQDTTAMDEFRFSPLSLWIPLHDITPENGALAIIVKTHWFFSPYRGVSFAFPFKKINDTIKKYLKPVFMKAGEVMCFDNRIIHNSMANTSDKPRIAVICGIFPKEATFQTCYRAPEENSPIELYNHPDSYMMDYPHFFYNCTDRPHFGEKGKIEQNIFPEMDAQEFEELCNLNGIEIANELNDAEATTTNCQLIAEPDGVNRFEEADAELAALVQSQALKSKGFFSFLKRSE